MTSVVAMDTSALVKDINVLWQNIHVGLLMLSRFLFLLPYTLVAAALLLQRVENDLLLETLADYGHTVYADK